MSRNELIALQKDCIQLRAAADSHGFFGIVEVKRGLKRESRRRKLPITAAMRAVLLTVVTQSKCKFVFTSPESKARPMSANTLEDQIRRTRAKLEIPKGAGLHTRRHTFLTHAGKLTQNVKALQLLAGHSNVATTKYVHPEEADGFGIVADMHLCPAGGAEGAPGGAGHTRLVASKSVPSKTPSVNSAFKSMAVSY